jgi:hypothetical protein
VTERFGAFNDVTLAQTRDWLVNAGHRRAEEVSTIALTDLVALLDEDVKRQIETEKGSPPKPDQPLSLRRNVAMWQVRYHDEEGHFPVKGNQFISWLAKLLAKPEHHWPIADLRGDPEGKLAADARLGGERSKDERYLQDIHKDIADVEAIAAETGSTEALEERREKLLQEVQKHSAKEQMETSIQKDYENVLKQRKLFIKKLDEMPQFAAHLEACIQSFSNDYTFAYKPPQGTLTWDIEK